MSPSENKTINTSQNDLNRTPTNRGKKRHLLKDTEINKSDLILEPLNPNTTNEHSDQSLSNELEKIYK